MIYQHIHKCMYKREGEKAHVARCKKLVNPSEGYTGIDCTNLSTFLDIRKFSK